MVGEDIFLSRFCSKNLFLYFSDIIGIPDFVSGAMEHWGLVTFRETSVLYTPNESSLSNKKRISLTVAHELAHMWFGNLGKQRRDKVEHLYL